MADDEFDGQATARRDRRCDRGRARGRHRVRHRLLRQRVGRRRQLPGRDPRGARPRPAVRDRAEGASRSRTARLRCEQEVAGRPRRLPRPAAGGRHGEGGAQPAALPVGARAGCAPRRSRSTRARRSGRSRGSRRCGWSCPEDEGTQAEVLGRGAEAAPAVVELLRRAGGRCARPRPGRARRRRADDLSRQALDARARHAERPGALEAVLIGPGRPTRRRARRAGRREGARGRARGPRRVCAAAWGRAIAELVSRLEPRAVVATGSERGNEVMAHAAAHRRPAVRRELHRSGARRPGVGHPRPLGRQPARGGARCTARTKLLTVAPHAVAAATAAPAATTEVERSRPELADADLVVQRRRARPTAPAAASRSPTPRSS